MSDHTFVYMTCGHRVIMERYDIPARMWCNVCRTVVNVKTEKGQNR